MLPKSTSSAIQRGHKRRHKLSLREEGRMKRAIGCPVEM
jgi:hypothetical protein